MKKTVFILTLVFFAASVNAQKSTTTTAVVKFDATTPKDALPKAENKTVIGYLDKTTGSVVFEAAVNNFAFTNAMIQDHFNGEKWLHSAAFPKFTFSGKIDKLSKVKFAKDGTYKATVAGTLTVKGTAKPVTAEATFVVANGKVNAAAAFSIKLADYGIAGQAIDAGKVATEPKVTVSAEF
ncbi:MAG: YceI family protein [Chitinophagaceae bacterium]|nr:YceI family protein [Chitinophagaceae bacterium]